MIKKVKLKEGPYYQSLKRRMDYVLFMVLFLILTILGHMVFAYNGRKEIAIYTPDFVGLGIIGLLLYLYIKEEIKDE